jgi:TonB-linked SusC/RagA family outer membrane protein
MMKSLNRRWLALLAAATLLPAMAWAQQAGSITGRVLERGTGRPIPDATVSIVGSGIGARTNEAGEFRLSGVAPGTLQVRATRIGYAAGQQNLTVPDGGSATADFQLGQVATQLDAVVTSAVTGQTQRAREVGTNVGSVSVADLEKGPIMRFADVLTGRTAGVTVQTTAGTAGTGQRIRVRGSNSLSLSNEPLVFIDGTNVTNSNALSFGVGGQAVSRLNDVSPNDIEKVEILKGPAATAIYGTAAANGVLLVTTKRGRSGKSRWNMFAETGLQKDKTDYPANYLRYTAVTPGAPVFLPTGAFNTAARPACFNYNRAAGTCTGDSVAVFNTLSDIRTSPFSEGRLTKVGGSVSGGNDQTQYYLGVDNASEHGIVRFNTLNKLGLRANLNTQLMSNMDFAVSSQYTRSKLGLNSNDNSVFSPLINGLVGSPFFSAPDPTTGRVSSLNYRAFSMSDLQHYVTHQNVDRMTIGGIGNYRPFTWLSGNVNLGLDYINRFDFRTLQPGRLPIAQSFTIGSRESDRSNNYLYTGTGSATASFDPLRSLSSRTTVGGSYNRNLLQGTRGTGNGIVEGTQNLGAASSLFTVDEAFSEVKSIGIFIREELAWADRVFLTASLRRDDNSAFGTDFGFITYPGVSGSWVLSDEPWFPSSNLFSNLRLRAAYGESGTRPDFRDAVTFFTPVSVSVAGVEQSAITLGRTGNLQLRPELTKETEFGGDISFLNDRVSLELTRFHKRSSDALISVPMAPSFGLVGTAAGGANILRNLGSISNKGTEAQLDVSVFDTERTALTIRGTATSLTNKIVEIGKDATGKNLPDIVINRGEQRHRTGYSAGAFFQRPVTYNDANGDGLLSRAEVTLGDTAVFLGESIPKWSRAVSADLKLFRFIRLYTLIEGRGGNKQLNATERFRCGSAISFGDRGCSATGNPNASLKDQAAFIASQFGGGAPSLPGTSSDLYIDDGGYTKWRELSITLEIPNTWRFLRLGSAQGASISLSGRNLKTWTKYPGLDPEIVESATSNFNQSEFNTQPLPRFYTLRFNLNL